MPSRIQVTFSTRGFDWYDSYAPRNRGSVKFATERPYPESYVMICVTRMFGAFLGVVQKGPTEA